MASQILARVSSVVFAIAIATVVTSTEAEPSTASQPSRASALAASGNVAAPTRATDAQGLPLVRAKIAPATREDDVIVRGDRTVGIELANLFLVDGGDPTSLQQQRRFRERVIAVAQAHYEAAGGARFEFTIGFDPRTPVTHVDRVGIALAEIALQAQVGDGGEMLRSCHAGTPEIHSISRTRSTYANARWRGVQGFMVPLIDPKRVQDAVDAKLQKLPAYRRCDSQWLLLVADFMDSAQDVELQWRADAELRRGGFDRVLIYKPQFAELFEPASAP